MPRLRPIKTNFARGEIDPLARMRSDIVAFSGGADKLRNVRVFPQGGVKRRDGLEFIDTIPPSGVPVLPATPIVRVAVVGNVRYIEFNFAIDQEYLFIVTVEVIYIYRDDVLIFELAHTYLEAEIPDINWTQKLDTLLLFHPEHEVAQIQRQGADSSWALSTVTITNPPTLVFDNTALGNVTPSAATGLGITLTFTTAQAGAAEIGRYVRGNGGFAKITATTTNFIYTADVLNDFTDASLIEQGFWTKEEDAFSSTRGWPISGTFFQGRLCIAGTRDSPQLFATSRSGVFNDFFAGNADDDSGIIVLSDAETVATFINIYAGRHLQIYASDSEWYIPISELDPITPKNTILRRNSSVGGKQGIKTEEVDGVVYFIQRGGGAVREFVFVDTEAAYTTDTVSLLSSHLIETPVDMALRKSLSITDPNYLWIVNSDGTLATFCVLRSEEVNAWTLYSTTGNFMNAAVLDQDSYFHVDRTLDSTPVKLLEKFNEDLLYDSGEIKLTGGPYTQTTIPHLANETVQLTLDGAFQGEFTMDNAGLLVFPRSADTYQIGLPFPVVDGNDNNVWIKTLPADEVLPEGTAMGKKKRVVNVTARVFESQAFRIQGNLVSNRNLGPNLLDVPITPVTDDIEIRGFLGWNDFGQIDITQKEPYALTLLGLAYDLSV